MADKLIIAEDRHGYRIRWALDDDPLDAGAILGERNAQDDEDAVAREAVRHLQGTERDSWGYYWASLTAARAALRVAKAAVRVHRAAAALRGARRPLPRWAKVALAENWRPPRGWRPWRR
jgi:hypothetical protein